MRDTLVDLQRERHKVEKNILDRYRERSVEIGEGTDKEWKSEREWWNDQQWRNLNYIQTEEKCWECQWKTDWERDQMERVPTYLQRNYNCDF